MTSTISVVDPESIQSAVQTAVQILDMGGVVLYPTDTTYALGVNALDAQAVERVFQLKGRDYTKPIHVIVPDIEQATTYVQVNDVARQLAEQFLPGALTLVLPLLSNSLIPPLLVAGANTLGIRIPKHPICATVATALNFPITTTSANRSGLPNTYTIQAAREQLNADIHQIDLILDGGNLPSGGVSTVVAVEGERVRLIREGAIPFATISASVQNSQREGR